MRIRIGEIKGNIVNTMRELGYHPDRGRNTSFSRSLRGTRYPRFHIYYDQEKGELNLHLDQKAPRYKGAPDHGAEYDGKLVEEEKNRIKEYLNDNQ